jgi:hypothetical protein
VRRIVGLVIVALMLAILSPSPAGAMTAWYPYNFPGGSWAWFYVNPAVVPQWCIGLGGPGDTGRADGDVQHHAAAQPALSLLLDLGDITAGYETAFRLVRLA